MKIAVCGISGFVGEEVKKYFEAKGFEVIGVERKISSNSQKIQELIEKFSGCEVVINLSGAPIIKPWTKKYKKEIYDSRINTTQNISKAISQMKFKPKLLISTSAVGIYQANKNHDEYNFNHNEEFLGEVCKDWEMTALKSESDEVRVVITRLGVVVGQQGGVVKKLFPLFNFGLGAVILPAKSSFPFVHINDLIRAYEFFIESKNSRGVYNIVASNSTTQLDFARAFAKALKRPLLMVVPRFILKIVYGGGADVISNNPFVESKRLREEGFEFNHSTIYSALSELK